MPGLKTSLKRLGVALAIAGLGLPALALAQKAQDGPSPDARKANDARDELAAIGRLLQSADYAAAAPRIDAFVTRPEFKAMPADVQHGILLTQGMVAFELRRFPEALAAFRRTSTGDDATATDWFWRTNAAQAAGDYRDATLSVIALTRFGRDGLAAVSDDYLLQLASIYARRAPDGEALQVRLIDALFDAGWDKDASSLWTRQAAAKLDAADSARATALLRKVTAPSSLLLIAVDRRFDAIRTEDRARFDVRAALERDLEEKRLKSVAPTASLKDEYTYGQALMQRGRFDDALIVLDAALRKADAPDAKAGSPQVEPEDLIWALDTRSRIYVFLGRHDEAVADLRRAARRPERGQMNVSHAINLGALYGRIDRPADALDAVSEITESNVSPYGLMQVTQVRACAYAALDRTAELKVAVAWLKDHAADAPGAVEEVASCTGDERAAATSLIARLDDPESRAAALGEVQTYIQGEHPTASDLRNRQFASAVRARPDVIEAVERVGRVESWPVIGPQF